MKIPPERGIQRGILGKERTSDGRGPCACFYASVSKQTTSGGFGELLKNAGFQSFLWTQFLGAFNDNLYKTVVSLRAVDLAAKTGTDYLFLSGGVFVLPFLLFSGYSGHFADRLSKRSILIAVKIFEIFVMALGLAVFFTDRIEWMLVVLFLMALHSTIFSPAKYGIVPEMLPEKHLSRANALLEMTTFMAIVLGTSISSFLFDIWAPWKIGAAMTAIAVIGFFASLGIPRTPAASHEPFHWNPFADVILGTKSLLRDRPMWLAVIGISFFWMLGALFQLNLLLYGSEVLHVDHQHLAWMVTGLALGIGAGNLLAGKLSGDRVELGLVPIGGFLIGIASLALAASGSSYGWSVAVLAILGVVSGPYIVPLNTFLQHRSGSAEKGRIMATNSFYNTVGLMIAFGVSGYVHDRLGVSTEKLFLGAGVVTLLSTIYLVKLLPDHLVRLILRAALHTVFRIRIHGSERVPRTGGALLVSNHVSFVDALLIGAATERRVRFMVWKPYYQHWTLNWFFRQMHSIPVGNSGPRDMVAALTHARQQLEQGHVVCIFAEGAITRTGNIQPFKRGMEKIAKGSDVPIVPLHLDRLWGSIFSYAGSKFFAKLPSQIPYPVTVSFGEPLASNVSAQEAHQAVLELSSESSSLRKEDGDTLPSRFVRSSRRNWKTFAMADSSGRELTHGRVLTASLLVSDWVRRNSKPGEKLGLLLPSSAGGALANIGVTLAGRIPVNLNFTAGRDAMASAAAQCNIRTVITLKVFIAKAKLEAPEGAVYLEDILGRASGASKLWALLRAKLAPASWLYPATTPDSLATVLFSSGSTSTPKGVMLSHHNVIANIEQMLQVFHLNEKDRIVGVLPFFHSFGFTVTLWLPALSGSGAIYHANPMDAKIIGELVTKYRGTFLLSTPTFAGTYARKCTREQFSSLRFVLVGAEKLRESVAQDFEQAFGLKMLEGYGCTEMAPVVAVNTPDWEAGRDTQFGTKPSSVGRPLPGVAARIVDPETFEPLPRGTAGLLLVKGSNRMLGYLGQPERTADALRDGWYNTGDIAVMDEEGFLRITDRLARFSKIAGEMVPHLAVEEAVREATGGEACCVTGIPDERKGERIAVLYTAAGVTPQEVWQRLAGTELPKLWLPKREDIHLVDALPTLGTGKLDLRGVRARALELAEVARA
jgi:acyl-[acyl-carrier-protein]-phospholipid O-acyltransferase / long-chain-fatty-acid--[acyl-carrier-protein] ligase